MKNLSTANQQMMKLKQKQDKLKQQILNSKTELKKI
jgi:hypothetical protein